jgi:hypothetical protein
MLGKCLTNVKMDFRYGPGPGTSFALGLAAGTEDEVSAYHGWLICKEAYFFMATANRRAAQRLSIQFDVLYRKASPILGGFKIAKTLNVSVGGICFHTTDDTLLTGTILDVELRIPPRHGVFEMGGRIRGLIQVLRVHKTKPGLGVSPLDQAFSIVAAKFCRRPTSCEVLACHGPGPFKDLYRRSCHVNAIID